MTNTSTTSYLNSKISHALVAHNWAAYDFHIVKCGTEEEIDELLKEYVPVTNKISRLVGQSGEIWVNSDLSIEDFVDVNDTEMFYLGYIFGKVSKDTFKKILKLREMLEPAYGANILCKYSDIHLTKIEFNKNIAQTKDSEIY